MLNTMSLAAVALALTGQVPGNGPLYPDALDTLRGEDTRPQAQMVVDSSGSMNGTIPGQNPSSPICPYFSAARITTPSCTTCASCPTDSACTLTKMDMLQASLTGCANATDGILFQWGQRVMFAIRAFGTGGADGLVQNGAYTAGFHTPSLANSIELMNAVNTLVPTGGTPLGIGYAAAGAYQSSFFAYDGSPTTSICGSGVSGTTGCNNTLQCRQNYLIVMSDGSSNGGSSTYNFVGTNGSITVNDGYVPGPAGSYVDYASRYMVRDLADNTTPIDALPNVQGAQQIRTYTIAFAAGTNATSMLNAMANEGEGQPYNATNYQTLSNAFQQIILSVVARSNVAFNPGTIQNDGFFSGNYIYTTSFRPFDRGYWLGTTKKYCVDPAKAKPPSFGNDDCLFYRNPVTTGPFFMNDDPRDIWSDSKLIEATTGGTGAVLAAAMLQTVNLVSPPPASSPAVYSPRRIMTWSQGSGAWLNIDPIAGDATVNQGFSQTSGQCAHRRLINKLFGYSDSVGAGCTGTGGDPQTFEWPIGDTVNGSTTLIRYTDECESALSRCTLAVNANDGMMHFYNTRDGMEVAAVVPGELWTANNVANNQLRDIMDQPNLVSMRRFYFDGKSQVYHGDTNGNGFIDGTEQAYLIAGLGRGGKAYYRFDVGMGSALEATGDPTAASPSTRPQALMVDSASGFGELRDTWAQPWIGLFNDLRPSAPPAPNNRIPVAVFPSGHDRTYDIEPNLGATVGGITAPPPDSNTSFQTYNCGTGMAGDDIYVPPSACSLQGTADLICTALSLPPPVCNLSTCSSTATAIGVPIPCYDWAGYSTFLPTVGSSGTGFTIPYGPYSFNNPAGVTGIAYRVSFTTVNLQPGDTLSVMDSSGNVINTFGTTTTATMSDWIYDSSFRLELNTDNVNATNATGWVIDQIHYQRSSTGLPGAASNPTLYVVSINDWNGSTSPNQFAQPSDQANTGIVAALMNDCSAANLPNNTVCLDAGDKPDLGYLTCPIVADPAVFAEGGVFRTAYVGDLCGQIFAFDFDPNASTPLAAWGVRRLAHLNNVNAGTGISVVGAAKDFRKIFQKLDLVVTTCTGSRRIGVYFGTGNDQHAALDYYLRDGSVSSPSVAGWGGPIAGADNAGGRPDVDVIGAIWDSGTTRNQNLTTLFDATTVGFVDPTSAPNGYFIALSQDEKMLSSPLVLDGVAYFRTYLPTSKATECVSASGIASTYVFDNCNAAAILNQDGLPAPSAWERLHPDTESSDGGSDLLLYAPADGPPQVFTGSIPQASDPPRAALPGRPNARSMSLYLWRLNVDPLF